MTPDDLERIELKLAFLERANQELSDVVYRQQQEIDALRMQVKDLLGRVESLREQPTQYGEVDERPPHY
ncbi:MAG TPA: SlyX family protein [Povalibacter sp.]